MYKIYITKLITFIILYPTNTQLSKPSDEIFSPIVSKQKINYRSGKNVVSDTALTSNCNSNFEDPYIMTTGNTGSALLLSAANSDGNSSASQQQHQQQRNTAYNFSMDEQRMLHPLACSTPNPIEDIPSVLSTSATSNERFNRNSSKCEPFVNDNATHSYNEKRFVNEFHITSIRNKYDEFIILTKYT